MSGTLRCGIATILATAILIVVGGLLPTAAAADPVLNAVTPNVTAANTGATIILTGTGFGAPDDRVYFDDNPALGHAPIAWAVGSLTLRVPVVSSGFLWVKSHGQGPSSNHMSIDITWSYRGAKWPPQLLPFTWFMQRDGAPGCDIQATADALKAAYDTWACASGITMSYGGRTPLGTPGFDGTNLQFWAVGGNGVIANASVYDDTLTKEILEFDIQYNTNAGNWGAPTDGLKLDVQDIATHEEGHSIGFLDLYGAFDPGKTMFGVEGGGETRERTLSPGDVEGAEWMYPHAGRPNLATGSPGGWGGALVPRNTSDANGGFAPLPAELAGNATGYVNVAMSNTGNDCASPYFSNRLLIDDSRITAVKHLGPWAVGAPVPEWLNLAHDFTGGRHTIAVELDTAQDVVESSEPDNAVAYQFVWSPLPLTTVDGVFRTAPPPPPGNLAQPNSDGFSYQRTVGFAWVVSEAPVIAGDDYDLYVYDDYTGSTSGFSHPVKTSSAPDNKTDYVVGHFAGTPVSSFPAVVRNVIAGGGGPFAADARDAVNRNSGGGETAWLAQTLVASRLADVYEVNIVIGQTYYLALKRTAGVSDLRATVYPGIGGGLYSRLDGAGATFDGVAPDLDTLKFTAAATGWHPIVVYRDDGAAITSNVTYDLRLSTHAFVDVPGGPTRQKLAFAGARPNPAPGGTQFEFTLAEPGPVRLELFDLMGRSVRTLVAELLAPGEHRVEWDGRDRDGARSALGLYVARFEAGGRVIVRRVTLLR